MFDLKRIVCLAVAFAIVLAFPFCASSLSASAAAVINGDTGDILYSHNAGVRLPMASTTKIMTALLMLENCGNLDREIVATKEMVTVEGSSMGLLAGDRVSFRALLYGMMLSSGNDAANAAAIAIGGSIENFVAMMNKKACDLGLVDTNFVTPSGLDGERHYTTAYELALITREALKNPDFATAAAAKSATLCFGNPPYRRTVKNHNRLLGMYDDIIGVKTGFTKKSGRCLVSAAKRDGRYVIAVTLNDGNDWEDHRSLLDIGLSVIEVYRYNPENADIFLPVLSGGENSVSLSSGGADFCIPKGQNVNAVVCLPRFLYSPPVKNEVVGNIEYYCSGRLVYKSNLMAKGGVKRKKYTAAQKIFEIFRYMTSII